MYLVHMRTSHDTTENEQMIIFPKFTILASFRLLVLVLRPENCVEFCDSLSPLLSTLYYVTTGSVLFFA